jgi:outer membrane protein assembly factor BamA
LTLRLVLSSFILSLLFLSGCTRELSLGPGEFLLVGQSVKGNQQIRSGDLEALLPQRPNRTFLIPNFTPFLYAYQISEQSYNPEKVRADIAQLDATFQRENLLVSETDARAQQRLRTRYEKRRARLQRRLDEGNWGMRVLGEPPSRIAERNVQTNVVKLRNYLFNKGFFFATVRYRMDTLRFLRNRVRVVYTVMENEPTLIDTIQRTIADPRIDSLVQSVENRLPVRPGVQYNDQLLDAERNQIDLLLRDNGYYGFDKSLIRYNVYTDTSEAVRYRADSLRGTPRTAALELDIKTARNQPRQPYYRIGPIRMIVDGATPEVPDPPVDTVRRGGILYEFRGKPYSPRLLDSKLRLRPGDAYSLTRTNETQRLLGTLDQFTFPQITFQVAGDSTDRRLNPTIYARPLDKYQLSSEVGLNVFQGLPGPFLNGSLRIRNILGGLEALEIAGRAGFEGQTGFLVANRPYLSFESGLNVSLIFPQILFPGNYRFRFNSSNPRTQVGLGFNYTNRPDYQRTNFKVAMNYAWQTSPKKTFFLSIFDANLISTQNLSRPFARYLDSLQRNFGNPLIFNFQDLFVSSISGSYVYSDNIVGNVRRARYMRLFLESGGTTLNLLAPVNERGTREFPFIKNLFSRDSMQFFRFVKINPDFRYYYPLSRSGRSLLATRLNLGAVYGYNDTFRAVPYEKYFFIGGPASLRAWRPRRLGPGSYAVRNEDGTVNYDAEQAGNLILEFSAEWRFHLFRFGGDFNGAFFVDAGNTWNFRDSNFGKPGGAISTAFLRDLAVGTGAGLRFDLSFFVVRADWGVKVFDPAQPLGRRYVLNEFSMKRRSVYGTNFNFAIGYPF